MQVITVYTKPKSKFSIVSWFIKLIEQTDFSHVAVVIHMDNDNVIAVFEASGSLVRFMNFEDWQANNEIIHGYLHEISEQSKNKLLTFCFNNVGKKYGFKQLIGMMYARLTKSKNPYRDGKASYVCSELIGYILNEVLDRSVDISKLEYEGPKYLQQLEESHAKNK